MWNDTPQVLDECRWKFPPPKEWPKSDLVGRGADLQPETLIHAYMNGVFPMSSELALGADAFATQCYSTRCIAYHTVNASKPS
jgi:Leu/Phe-tRNA-protein transferase